LKKKIKIYFFHPYSGKGGADLSISRLINGLDSSIYDIDFISLNYPKIKKKIFKNIKYKKINSNRVLFSFGKVKKIISEDKNYEKKIFISNQNFANVLSILFLKKINNLKIVLFERNHINELTFYNNTVDFVKKNIIKLLIKFFYRYADLVITNSKISSKDLKSFSNASVKTIYNPCFFKLHKRKKDNNKKQIILNVARFVDQKDHLTLLKGFKNAKSNKKFILYLVGYGEKNDEIKFFIKKNNLFNVKIFHNKHDLKEIYQKSNLFILTSKYEGFPNVIVEAASFRIPIISTNFKSGSSEILLNGKAGTIFKVGDHQKLSKLIDDFCSNKKKYLIKEKKCSVSLSRFSNLKIISLFNQTLLKLIK